MPELRITNLAKRFGDNWGVRDINLHVKDGEFFTLLGPSGCGKSTTLACVAGLEIPDGGSIESGGKTFYDESQKRIVPPEERGLGLVFQTYALWPHMTVYQNLEFPLKMRRRGKSSEKSRRARIMEVLELVELTGYENRYPHQLSGGQQQRVALGRAVVYEPNVLLLDEPLSNLDAKLRERARGWVKHLQRETGITTLYVTHDQSEALALSDRIAVMRDGIVVQMGPPEEIYDRPVEAFVADFVGSSNFMQGTVAWMDGSHLAIEVAGFDAPVRAVLPISGERPEVGSQVALAVRPERVGILAEDSPNGSAATNRANALVQQRSYLGSIYEYELRVGESTILATSSLKLDSSRLAVSIEPEAIMSYPAEKAQEVVHSGAL